MEQFYARQSLTCKTMLCQNILEDSCCPKHPVPSPHALPQKCQLSVSSREAILSIRACTVARPTCAQETARPKPLLCITPRGSPSQGSRRSGTSPLQRHGLPMYWHKTYLVPQWIREELPVKARSRSTLMKKKIWTRNSTVNILFSKYFVLQIFYINPTLARIYIHRY